jgi:predicted N-acyltransferase
MLISCNKVPNKKESANIKPSSDFAFTTHTSINNIDSNHWNSVAQFGSPFLKTTYLTALENEHPENMNFYYTTIYKGQSPVAIAYFQLVNFSAETFDSFVNTEDTEVSCAITGYLKKYITDQIMRSVNKANIRLLVCGNCFVSGEHGLTCIPMTSKTEVFDALADIIYEINQTEKSNGKISAVLVKDFYASEKDGSEELKEFKYHDFLVEPNMIVNINWPTFEDYLNAMSKKYRNRAKNIVKKGTEIQRNYFSASDIKKNADKIQLLYDNVHLKATFRMASLSTNYFVEMKKALGDKFNFVGYYYNDELVGFRTCFILNDSIEAHFVGINYEINKELELYQNMLYDYVKESIDNSVPKLTLGRTAAEIKSTVGAEAYQLICYIRHRNPLSNRLIKPFIDSIKTTEWIPRNPFKETAVQGV